ncbi:helix-turn-helix domain-containing protein [Dyadobacter sp. LHD-138]|uniref:helix-turn-helix domain-containing protein n=1 Tax=Dyadobacter sp. LHD-138 TaxID=3071413 RepID=UPI0027E080C3|nr:helix-turn-helix domain-containing protein [Dyadobacter sp. LHD-138]MDQ6482132.1 helix-turn-helix domain-containing protein [Dyadobacter sp. LHD-138]
MIVLVIEDGTDVRNFCKDVLIKYFHVVQADNGADGIAIARKIGPDLILCGMSVPLLGGLEVCEILKSDSATSHIFFILLDTEGSELRELAGLRAGANDYISRPLDSKILELKIDNLIHLGKALRGQYPEELSPPLKQGESEGPFLDKIRQLAHDNISDPDFGVHQMAFQAGVSVSVLYRKLRSLTGITVHDFVKTIRMKKAMQLLETGINQVNEVATAVGYEDSKYFSKEFRKTFGKTPMEIKRNVVELAEQLI